MKNYTISERLKLTLGNIKHQQNRVFWDDLEKLEEVLERVQKLEKHFEDYQQIIQRIAQDDTSSSLKKEREKARHMEVINLKYDIKK